MGIIAKIWNIKAGSQGRSGGAQISSSVDYITNSEKCDGQLSLSGMLQVGREVAYVTNDIKTLAGLYIGARNISDISNAVDEMMQVKRFYQKLDGRVALHGIISLDEDESSKENAGKLMLLCDELMERIFPDNQIVYAVHTNTENLHIHFIANSVGLDGKKIHMDKNFMREVFEPAVNELALKYGFSPNEAWMRVKKPDEVSFKDRKIMLRKAIDLAVEESDDFESFLKELRDERIVANVGRHLSLRMEGMIKPVRSGQLGEQYSIDAIKERIVTKREPFIKLSMEQHIKSIVPREVVSFVPTTLKKYKDMSMIRTPGAVILGMVYNYLPYMILPLYSVLVKIDHRLIEAAEDLGCNSVQVFAKVVFPLSVPGILSGFTMVFVPAVSTFYISQKLGNPETVLIGDIIERQFKQGNNPNLGAALSLVLMILVFVCTGIMNRLGADDEGGVVA